MSAKLVVMLQRVTWAVLGAAAIVALSGIARADDGPGTPCPDVAKPPKGDEAPASLPTRADAAAEERAFDREVERYLRQRAFTERLVAERAASEFKEDEARYERFRELTNKLTLEAERAAEREFERAVELHVAKIRLTKALTDRDTNAPLW